MVCPIFIVSEVAAFPMFVVPVKKIRVSAAATFVMTCIPLTAIEPPTLRFPLTVKLPLVINTSWLVSHKRVVARLAVKPPLPVKTQ